MHDDAPISTYPEGKPQANYSVAGVDQPIVEAIWDEKYRAPKDFKLVDTFGRVAAGVCKLDPKKEFVQEVFDALNGRRLSPGGRIFAGAGTEKHVTMINCYVSDDIQDSLRTIPERQGLGIMDALRDAAFTQQMGGGIGMDFSTLRPAGAIVRRTGSEATGPLPFMDMWHAMCATVKSSGSRRGAMMGTMRIDHPDILKFITAKQEKGRLTNFNVSVLVTDAFMQAVKDDQPWELVFNQPRADLNAPLRKGEGKDPTYVYQVIQARELWKKIIENTYIYAEPGIIFIDRINQMNNLWYCEDIHCTNPCGEQPLPRNGDCNLGHANLAAMVPEAFITRGADSFSMGTLQRTIATAVRFLDNVLDVSLFATQAQKDEAIAKRRTGIGFTGLGTALQLMGVRYGSPEAIEFTRDVSREICYAAYRASIELAKERGPFPMFDKDKYLQGKFIQKLPEDIRQGIAEHGIRNGVLLTVAPTGTTSVLAGNVSSGIEPVFALKSKRAVLQNDGTYKTYDPVWDYGYLAWCQYHNVDPDQKLKGGLDHLGPIPNYINCTIEDLTVERHLAMQAASQEWVDASISKTINVPESHTFEDFERVYTRAYELGLKGCTTYRPDPRSGRGAVITKEEKPKVDYKQAMMGNAGGVSPAPYSYKRTMDIPTGHDLTMRLVSDKVPMQRRLEGVRYQVKWPGLDHAFYVQINDYVDAQGQKRPFELFISTKSAQHDEWLKGISRLATGIFRRGGNVTFIVEELRQVSSARGGAFYDRDGNITMVPSQRHVGSLVAAIADVIEEHFQELGLLDGPSQERAVAVPATPKGGEVALESGDTCPRCNSPTLHHAEGCASCSNCGYSNCA